MNEQVFIIDICGTMFKSNTTFDFVKYFFHNKWRVKMWFSKPYRIYNYIMFHFFHYEPLRHNLIMCLEGITKDKLQTMAEVFFCQYLKEREHKQTIDVIEAKRLENCHLMIVSATIDVIAQTVASHYNISSCYSTLLEYDANNVCTGRINIDLLSNKSDFLIDKGLNPPYAGIITDNYSDKDLIENSKNAFLITYKNKKNKWSLFIKNNILKRCKLIEVE